jgi:hypothetical protein
MIFGRFNLRTSGIVAGVALVLGSLSAVPVKAAEDTNTFNSFLGFFGMQFDKEQEDSIDYRARAPLVVPPKLDLPPPQSADSRHPADWPVDPDIVARRKALADSNRPAPQITPNTRPELSKDQLLANRGETVIDDTPNDGCSALGGSSLCAGSPWKYVTEKMGIGKKEDEKVVLSGTEPPRKYLTEPPPGYRIPTANTKVVADKVRAQPDSGDAQAYSRNEQTHKRSVDDQ